MQIYLNPICKGKYRNQPCICGSGKKSKKCHGYKRYLGEAEYKEYSQIILTHNVAVEKMLNENNN